MQAKHDPGPRAGPAPPAPETTDRPSQTLPRRAIGKPARRPWPSELAEQTNLVRGLLTAVSGTVTAAEVARFFDGAKPARLEKILDTLVALGHARKTAQGYAAG